MATYLLALQTSSELPARFGLTVGTKPGPHKGEEACQGEGEGQFRVDKLLEPERPGFKSQPDQSQGCMNTYWVPGFLRDWGRHWTTCKSQFPPPEGAMQLPTEFGR